MTGTPLADREMVVLDVPASLPAIAIMIGATEVLDAWRIARDRLEVTGRWPIALTTWQGAGAWAKQLHDEKLFDRWYYQQGSGTGDVSPAALVRAVEDVDVEAFVRDRIDQSPYFRDEGEDPGGDLGEELDWYVPTQEQATALVLLPTPRAWESLAYQAWYPMEGIPAVQLLALLRSWEHRFGAELVANWGTMLQLVVARPPQTLDEATALAFEHLAVAPCTTVLPGSHTAAYARALVGRGTWFLHERP